MTDRPAFQSGLALAGDWRSCWRLDAGHGVESPQRPGSRTLSPGPLRARAAAGRAGAGIRRKNAPDHSFVTTSLNNLAALHSILGAYERTESLYRRSLEITEDALGHDPPNVATSLFNLATLHEIQGQHEKAEPLYQRALGILEKPDRPNRPLLASVLMNLAVLYRRTGRDAQAKDLEKRAESLGVTVR